MGKILSILVFSSIFSVVASSVSAREIKPKLEFVRHPAFNNIQKEMLRLRDKPEKEIVEEDRKNYRAWLALEDYFLFGGVTPWGQKILARLILMRDREKELKKKAVFECQSWRIFDVELRTRNESVWKEIAKKGYGDTDYRRLRVALVGKLRDCLPYIGEDYRWTGPNYGDRALDIKARLATAAGERFFLLALEKEKEKKSVH